MQVELQLQGGMPFLEGERGAPKEPEIALEEILAHDFVDALVLHLLTGGEEDPQQVFLPLVVQRQQGLVRHVLPLALGEALERVIGVGLVDPAELVEHAGAFDLERRDRAEQVPLAFHMIFQLAAAADDEALFGHLDPSSAPPGNLSSSRMVIFSPAIWPSRIRNAAPARDARPEPTNHAVLFSTPSGFRGLAKAS